jgi:hypothetical protein
LFQGYVGGDFQGGIERHVDVGQLQGRPAGLVDTGVDLPQLEAGQVFGQRIQIVGDDRLGLLRVFTRMILKNAVASLKSYEIQGWTRGLSEWKESPDG